MSQQFPPDNGQSYQPQQPGYPQQPYMPPPGYSPQQQPSMYTQPPKKRAKWPFFVGGGCLVLLLATCGILAASGIFAAKSATISTSQAVATIGAASTALATVTVDTGSSTNTSTIAKLGQTITVNGYAATLVSVKTLQADEFNTPKAGMQFIVVHVTLKNTGTSQVSYNPFDFHIKSSKGNVTDADFAQPQSYTANNVLNSGNLDPAGSVNGDIIFQAPKGDVKAELTWSTSIFSSTTQYGWTLGTY